MQSGLGGVEPTLAPTDSASGLLNFQDVVIRQPWITQSSGSYSSIDHQSVQPVNSFVFTDTNPLIVMSYPDTKRHPGPPPKALGADRVQIWGKKGGYTTTFSVFELSPVSDNLLLRDGSRFITSRWLSLGIQWE